jgi:hypothetical protein
VKAKFESPHIESDPAEQEYQALSGREKFERLLSLFGTETARDRFIETCRNYVAERRKDSGSGRTEYLGAKQKYSPPKRANFHNAIMDTLKRLATQTKKIDPVTEKILREVASREDMAAIAMDWVAANEYGEDEDEDQKARRGTTTPTAFFHSRGED